MKKLHISAALTHDTMARWSPYCRVLLSHICEKKSPVWAPSAHYNPLKSSNAEFVSPEIQIVSPEIQIVRPWEVKEKSIFRSENRKNFLSEISQRKNRFSLSNTRKNFPSRIRAEFIRILSVRIPFPTSSNDPL